MNKEEWLKVGYVDELVNESFDSKAGIDKLCKEKNSVILGYYYQSGQIQDIADFVGDSLVLAQWVAKADGDIIVMCGVHFMGKITQLLCLNKKVLVYPEYKGAVTKLVDKVASTAGLLKHAVNSSKKDFIVTAESGIFHESASNVEKVFLRKTKLALAMNVISYA